MIRARLYFRVTLTIIKNKKASFDSHLQDFSSLNLPIDQVKVF